MKSFTFIMLLSLFLIISNDKNKRTKKFLNIVHKNHHLFRKLEVSEGILMGFDKYSSQSNYFKFKTKVKYPNDNIIKTNITIPINILYNNGKDTESKELFCLNNTNCIDSYCTYECSLQIETQNISKVKFNDKDSTFTLSSLGNITKDISSQKENDNKNSELLDRANISFLDNSNISLKSGRHFIICGDLKSDFVSNNIKLIISKNTYRRDLSCKGYRDIIYPYKYYLDCDTSISSINADLDNTFAYLEDDKDKGFIINFDETNNSTVIQTNDYINKKNKSSGLSTGGIIAIMIPCIILLLLIGGIVYFLRNRAPNEPLKKQVNNNVIAEAAASSEAVVNQ